MDTSSAEKNNQQALMSGILPYKNEKVSVSVLSLSKVPDTGNNKQHPYNNNQGNTLYVTDK